MKKYLLAFLFILPSTSFSADLDGYYISLKAGVSNSGDNGYCYDNDNGGDICWTRDDLGTGYIYGLSVGKRISDNIRIELEANKRDDYKIKNRTYYTEFNGNTSDHTADIDSKTLFLNILFDFQSILVGKNSVKPYIGAGVGYSRNRLSTVREENILNPIQVSLIDGSSKSNTAYKLTAGLLFDITENLSVDVNYQYVDLGSFKSDTGTELLANGNRGTLIHAINGAGIDAHEILIGLQYKF